MLFTSTAFANDEMLETQADSTGVTSFLENSQKYTEDLLPDLDLNELFQSAITGDLEIDGIIGTIVNLLGNELETAIESMILILIIIIIHSILKVIIESLGNDATSKIAYFIQYLIIVTIIINTFSDMLDIMETAISDVTSFMNILVPLLITLMLTSGSIVSSSTIQPVLLLMINVMGNLIEYIMIPLILVSTTLAIVSNFSDKVHLTRLSKFMKSAIVWMLGIMLTIFICVLSIEGTLSSSVDELTSKTTKAAVSTFIPVVGKVLGDSVETVIGCVNILKSAVGAIGTVIIFSIVAVPIIKIVIMWALLRLVAAFCEIIADEKIIKLIDTISDSYKILFAILVSVSIMFIIGITIVVKMTSVT